MNDSSHPSRGELLSRLDSLPLAEVRRFRRRLDKARAPQALRAIADDLDAAAATVATRDAAVPDITYPEQLPVSARRDDIMELMRNHQVVVIAGETGSGKTTQIPKTVSYTHLTLPTILLV